jgi:S1-C subfamily serine protease
LPDSVLSQILSRCRLSYVAPEVDALPSIETKEEISDASNDLQTQSAGSVTDRRSSASSYAKLGGDVIRPADAVATLAGARAQRRLRQWLPSGCPTFRAIVEQCSGAVVNISAVGASKTAVLRHAIRNERVPELLPPLRHTDAASGGAPSRGMGSGFIVSSRRADSDQRPRRQLMPTRSPSS